MPNKLVFTALFLASALGALSCKEDTITPESYGSISGLVLATDDRTPLTGANISTNPPTVSILTDNTGAFTIVNVPVGSYAVFATMKGFKNATVSVMVSDGMGASAAMLMERSTTAAPTTPSDPFPEHQSTGQPTSLTLTWSSTVPEPTDTLEFDVLLYETGSSTATTVASAIKDTLTSVQNLSYGSAYYWQVIAKDLNGNVVNGPLWSFTTQALPDYRVVFARMQDGTYDVYSTDSLGIEQLHLTSSPSREWWPRLSPRHDKIAFSSDVGVEPQIFSMNRDGSDIYRVTHLPVVGSHNYGVGFNWSPDGGCLLYSHFEKLYRIDADGSNLTLIATAPANRNFLECDWSPLGDRIIASTVGTNPNDGEIFVLDADGANMREVVGNLPGMIGSPSFSPDGESILYTVDKSGFESPDGRQLNTHIILERIDGTDSVDLSSTKADGTNDLHPRFSPDGSRVVFENAPNDDSAPADIWVVRIVTQLRTKIVINGIMPDWR